MDLHVIHQDIEAGFRHLRDLDPFERRRYIAWRLAWRPIRGPEQTRVARQPATTGRTG
jgi:hypothetical protein